MRSIILYLKKIGLQKVIGIFIALVLIIVASVYIFNKPTKLPVDQQANFDQGKYAESIPLLEKWVKDNPDDLNSMELLAASYIQKADNEPNNAKADLTKAIKVLNQIVTKDQKRSETYRLLGTARLYQNNISAAEASFNQALKVSNQKNVEAQVGLAMISEYKNNWNSAFSIYQTILKDHPTQETATLGLARYYVQTKNPKAVKESMSVLLLSTKNNAIKGEAYAILGSANVLEKDYINAVENYKKSLTYRPNNVHTIVLMGEAQIGQYRTYLQNDSTSIISQITETANKAILVKPDYIYAYALLYKVNLLQNKYPEANKIGEKIVSLLKDDKTLSDTEKAKYKEYYSGKITSVTITSLETKDVKGNEIRNIDTTNIIKNNSTSTKKDSAFTKKTTNNLKK